MASVSPNGVHLRELWLEIFLLIQAAQQTCCGMDTKKEKKTDQGRYVFPYKYIA